MTRQKNVCEGGYLQDDKNNGKFENCHPKRLLRKSGHAFVTNERCLLACYVLVMAIDVSMTLWTVKQCFDI